MVRKSLEKQEPKSKKKSVFPRPDFLAGEFNLPELEERVLAFWNEHHIFEKSLSQTRKNRPFTFYDGPPFATGLPHYGHILASTIKDVIPRYQTMQGRYVRRRWGWDCHGLPIEEIVERKLGISGKKQIEKIGIKKFNETCRSMVLGYADEWDKMIRRMARWVEFADSYKTMDTDYMESVWWAFKEIYKKNLVYQGRKVLLYCPRCETPVSNFEVAMDNSYKDVIEESVTVKFKIKNPEKINLRGENVYLLAWTTTPWTLPGNVALAVGRDIRYQPVSRGGEILIAAVDRLSDLGLAADGRINYQYSGMDLIGLEYEPLFDTPAIKSEKSYKVYPADFVTTTDGTGIVHTAVVYGEDDYNLGMKIGLPVVPMLDDRGVFNDKAPTFLRGQYFKKADALVISNLENRKPKPLLFKKERSTHSYPFCWRCGNVLFYNAIPSWFINVQKIKQKLIASNRKEINWFPAHLKYGRYQKSVEAAPDWNISRNRYWGNPLPVWRCEKCSEEEAIGGLRELSVRAGGSKNRYWVMRHGEAESNIFDILDSGERKYLHLTPRGRKQVGASIEKFKKELAKKKMKLDIIVASDVTRTHETEKIDASVFTGEKVVLDKRLQEIHLGPTLMGRRDEKYAEMFPTYQSRFEKRPEGGESLRDVRSRVWNFLKDCEEKYGGKNILIVTHEYPTWMLFAVGEAWSEKRAIAEKEKRANDFISFAEIRELNFEIVPRNDGGEADMHRPYIDEITLPCVKCRGTMRRTPELFDSWMEAGSMPFAEYHYPFENKDTFKKHLPAQFVAEYIAQTRAWFYVMHVISFILFKKAPFQNVVTTGTILAGDGSKMSKSKNNFPDPWLVINKYGADSIRFYLMNSVVMQADNLNFSEKGVEAVYRKVELLLVNVYKYFATYLPEKEKNKKRSEKCTILDTWILTRTAELNEAVTQCLNAYDTVHATRAIQDYIDDLSTWYLRRSRKRHDEAFFDTLFESLLTISKVAAPFMPFLAEAIFQSLLRKRQMTKEAPSIHLAAWPSLRHLLAPRERMKLLEGMKKMRQLASEGLAKRAEVGIKIRQPLAKMEIAKGTWQTARDKELLKILADEVNVKEIKLSAKLRKGEVVLDTAITPELRAEGIVRDIARMAQELRQKAGLQPKDRIAIFAVLPEEAANALRTKEKTFMADIGAKTISYARSEKFDAEESGKWEGQKIWIGIKKA